MARYCTVYTRTAKMVGKEREIAKIEGAGIEMKITVAKIIFHLAIMERKIHQLNDE